MCCFIMMFILVTVDEFAVTTTNQAIAALKLLRENRNKFDLVISDVHMPDMDGFKLLEHVGLEMDLPVISKHTNLCQFISFYFLRFLFKFRLLMMLDTNKIVEN